jgi:archaellum component FlaC
VKLLIEGYLEDYDGSGGSGGASDEDIKRLEQLIEDLTTLVQQNTTDIESIKKTLEEHSESITNIEQLIDTLE